jgi:two-component system, LytTR family, response regulator
MLPVTAFIVDDEYHSRKVISLMLKDFFPEIEIVGEAESVRKAVEGIKQTHPGIVFLDIQLQHETGFHLLDQTSDLKFEIIFVTAHDEYAVRAFKYSAIDYLVKPIDINEFQSAVERAKKRISQQQSMHKEQLQLLNLHLEKRKPDKIAIPSPNGLIFVDIQDIIYCQGIGNYTQIFLENGPKITSGHTLKLYEDLLTDSLFFRAHKSFLINLSHIKSYLRGEGGTVVMSNGHEIEIARRNKVAFLSLFKV